MSFILTTFAIITLIFNSDNLYTAANMYLFCPVNVKFLFLFHIDRLYTAVIMQVMTTTMTLFCPVNVKLLFLFQIG